MTWVVGANQLTSRTNVMPAEAAIYDTLRRGCACGWVADVDTCVDGRLRGHDGKRGTAGRSLTYNVIPAKAGTYASLYMRGAWDSMNQVRLCVTAPSLRRDVDPGLRRDDG